MLNTKIRRVFERLRRPADDDCPEPEVLAAYLDHRLDAAGRARLERHMVLCDRCADEAILVTEMKTVRDPAAMARHAAEQVDMVVRYLRDTVELVRNSTSVFPMALEAYAPARNRGGTSVNTARFYRDFEPFRAEVEVERFKEGNGEIRVKTTRDRKLLDRVRVSLMSRDKEVASYLTETGRVLFDDVHFGRYTLRFKKNGGFVGDITLKIEEDL